MAEYNWELVSDFERHPKLDTMKVGDTVRMKFLDNGTFVTAKQLKDAGAKFPRDSIVFVVEVKGEKKEWWISDTAYSVKKQLKRLHDTNGKLAGANVSVKRISDKNTETNYELV